VEKRDPSSVKDYGRDPEYADASIDAMREQKLAVRYFVCIKQTPIIFFYSLGITTLFNHENTFTFLIRIKKKQKKIQLTILFLLKCTHKIN